MQSNALIITVSLDFKVTNSYKVKWLKCRH